jgi:hypothetical protein
MVRSQSQPVEDRANQPDEQHRRNTASPINLSSLSVGRFRRAVPYSGMTAYRIIPKRGAYSVEATEGAEVRSSELGRLKNKRFRTLGHFRPLQRKGRLSRHPSGGRADRSVHTAHALPVMQSHASLEAALARPGRALTPLIISEPSGRGAEGCWTA